MLGIESVSRDEHYTPQMTTILTTIYYEFYYRFCGRKFLKGDSYLTTSSLMMIKILLPYIFLSHSSFILNLLCYCFEFYIIAEKYI